MEYGVGGRGQFHIQYTVIDSIFVYNGHRAIKRKYHYNLKTDNVTEGCLVTSNKLVFTLKLIA